MREKTLNWRKGTVKWSHFTGEKFAVFRSLGKEINICTLSVVTLAAVLIPGSATAQTENNKEKQARLAADSEYNLDELEVLGTRVPLSPEHSVRIVQVLTRQQIEATSAQSVNDLLKLVAGVDVRQRGAYGVQTDIGVNGGTSDQLTVLLNGINISNPHTGHLTVDLPVSVNDIERIEVLEGGASRVYGSSAFSGAINIVTQKDQKETLGLNLQGGSFGTLAADANLNFKGTNIANRVAGGYSRSDGGTVNSDFNKGNFFWNGNYSNSEIVLNWQAGMSTMNYGANTFYSAAYNNQYEENRRYLVSVSAETKGKIHFMPSLYWNRSLDHYLLFRNNPAAYENFHQTNVYGVNLNSYVDWSMGKTAFGVEVRNEGIISSSLGKPLEEKEYVKVPGQNANYTHGENRTNVSYYLEHDLLLDRVTISLGLLANMNTALDYRYRLYPGVDISWRPVNGWKLYASFNQALRMPTFTDLYYKSPTINGNIGLKPEKSTDYTLGVQYSSPAFQAKLKGFYRKGTDMIDWVKYSADDSYHSANFKLNNMGVELTTQLNFKELWGEQSFLKQLNVSYAYIYQQREDNKQVYDSNYALDYLKNKFVASLSHHLIGKLDAQWDVRLQHRNGAFILYEDGKNTGILTPYGTYCLLDLKLQWSEPKYTLFIQGNNLTNKHYYDLSNVEQPGFWFMGGIKVKL